MPSGPGYAGVARANQACPVAGYDTATGLVRRVLTLFVYRKLTAHSGSAYLNLSYGYTYSNVWRNVSGFGTLQAQLIFD